MPYDNERVLRVIPNSTGAAAWLNTGHRHVPLVLDRKSCRKPLEISLKEDFVALLAEDVVEEAWGWLSSFYQTDLRPRTQQVLDGFTLPGEQKYSGVAMVPSGALFVWSSVIQVIQLLRTSD